MSAEYERMGEPWMWREKKGILCKNVVWTLKDCSLAKDAETKLWLNKAKSYKQQNNTKIKNSS